MKKSIILRLVGHCCDPAAEKDANAGPARPGPARARPVPARPGPSRCDAGATNQLESAAARSPVRDIAAGRPQREQEKARPNLCHTSVKEGVCGTAQPRRQSLPSRYVGDHVRKGATAPGVRHCRAATRPGAIGRPAVLVTACRSLP